MAKTVLEAWEDCDRIDTLFIIVCTCICWTIVPTVSSTSTHYYLRKRVHLPTRADTDLRRAPRSALLTVATHGGTTASRVPYPPCSSSLHVQSSGGLLGRLYFTCSCREMTLAIADMMGEDTPSPTVRAATLSATCRMPSTSVCCRSPSVPYRRSCLASSSLSSRRPFALLPSAASASAGGCYRLCHSSL